MVLNHFSWKFMLSKRRFSMAERNVRWVFSNHFSMNRLPNRVLTLLKSGSKRLFERFVPPSKIFVWEPQSSHAMRRKEAWKRACHFTAFGIQGRRSSYLRICNYLSHYSHVPCGETTAICRKLYEKKSIRTSIITKAMIWVDKMTIRVHLGALKLPNHCFCYCIGVTGPKRNPHFIFCPAFQNLSLGTIILYPRLTVSR